jgi:molybdopterin-guanine dinucleotide biosynthesis protein A
MRRMSAYDAIVLAGGGGRRLGGVDKAEIRVGETTLLTRALDAVQEASRRVVVGPPRSLPFGVVRVQEDPPGGGPVAGLAAGLGEVREALVVVLACDMPFVDIELVTRLVTLARPLGSATQHPSTDGALVVDEQGRRQPLAAVYRTTSLRTAVSGLGTTSGAAMRQLTAGLSLIEMTTAPHTALDCDTWEGVARSRQLLEER